MDGQTNGHVEASAQSR